MQQAFPGHRALRSGKRLGDASPGLLWLWFLPCPEGTGGQAPPEVPRVSPSGPRWILWTIGRWLSFHFRYSEVRRSQYPPTGRDWRLASSSRGTYVPAHPRPQRVRSGSGADRPLGTSAEAIGRPVPCHCRAFAPGTAGLARGRSVTPLRPPDDSGP